MRPAAGCRRLGVVALAVVLAAGGCSDEPSIEAFCAAAERTRTAGPLFPDRTDGEPIPEPDALVALEELADAAPDDIDEAVQTLFDEARALVAEALARQDDTAEEPPARPDRAAVDTAQAAVIDYVAERCDLDLDAAVRSSLPGG